MTRNAAVMRNADMMGNVDTRNMAMTSSKYWQACTGSRYILQSENETCAASL